MGRRKRDETREVTARFTRSGRIAQGSARLSCSAARRGPTPAWPVRHEWDAAALSSPDPRRSAARGRPRPGPDIPGAPQFRQPRRHSRGLDDEATAARILHLVATEVSNESHAIGDSEEFRAESTVRIGKDRSYQCLRSKPQVGRPESRCRTIGVAVEVKSSIDRSVVHLRTVLGSTEDSLFPAPPVATRKSGQSAIARACDELGHIQSLIENRREHSGLRGVITRVEMQCHPRP